MALMIHELTKSLTLVRQKRPLVHCLTNVVTVNDCANALLSVGASPVMATAIEEAAEIAAKADSLCVNIGTLDATIVPAMFAAAAAAAVQKRPATLDPVGAGASGYRTNTSRRLLDTGNFTLLRGNASEIRAVAGVSSTTRGVDTASDTLSQEALKETIAIAQNLAKSRKIIVGVSGPVDVIASSHALALVKNGHPFMPDICGTGCMLSAVAAAFLGANRNKPFAAVLAAFCAVGLAGEIARERLADFEGPAAGRVRFLDALATLDEKTFEQRARFEILE